MNSTKDENHTISSFDQERVDTARTCAAFDLLGTQNE